MKKLLRLYSFFFQLPHNQTVFLITVTIDIFYKLIFLFFFFYLLRLRGRDRPSRPHWPFEWPLLGSQWGSSLQVSSELNSVQCGSQTAWHPGCRWDHFSPPPLPPNGRINGALQRPTHLLGAAPESVCCSTFQNRILKTSRLQTVPELSYLLLQLLQWLRDLLQLPLDLAGRQRVRVLHLQPVHDALELSLLAAQLAVNLLQAEKWENCENHQEEKKKDIKVLFWIFFPN